MDFKKKRKSFKNCFPNKLQKKEEDVAHALRGSLYLRTPAEVLRLGYQATGGVVKLDEFKHECTCHLLDYVASGQKHVTRATFSAELLGATDTVDRGFLIATIMHQIRHFTRKEELLQVQSYHARASWCCQALYFGFEVEGVLDHVVESFEWNVKDCYFISTRIMP